MTPTFFSAAHRVGSMPSAAKADSEGVIGDGGADGIIFTDGDYTTKNSGKIGEK
jgi:hypothetical protein